MRYLKDSDKLFRVKSTRPEVIDGKETGETRHDYYGPYGTVGAARREASRHDGYGYYHGRPAPTHEVEQGNVTWGPIRDGAAIDGQVLVDASELEALRTSAAVLDRLNAAGVDNWEGYGDALSGTWDS